MSQSNRRRFLASLAALSHELLSAAESVPDNGETGDLRAELRIADAYSPRDAERAKRPHTDYIILHTTEAGNSSSLNSVRRYGSCHYLILSDGQVRRIIHRDKIANHAGRSMWDGVRNLSTVSIGIEIVGKYTDTPREAQLMALKELLRQLIELYEIPDKNVLTHSQVAYSYHPDEGRMVRGRRKDAIQYNDPAVRARIGLNDRWTYDPDEEAGRVAFQDYAEGRWLRKALYAPGPAITAPRPALVAATREPGKKAPAEMEATLAKLPPFKTALVAFAQTNPGEADLSDAGRTTPSSTPQETDDPETFEGFQVLGVNGNTIDELAGAEALSPTTIYFLPDGRIRSGDRMRGSALLEHPPAGLKILIGYVIGGEVTRETRAINIAGAAWNYPSTFYRLPNRSIQQGDKIDDSAIPPGTIVFYRH